MKNLPFKGVCTALVTPFKKGDIDFESFGKLIDFQIQGGVDALLVLGTTGEYCTLTLAEKKAIVEFAFDKLKSDSRIRKVALVIGIGGNNPSSIIDFGKFVAATYARCRAVPASLLLSSPYYNKATQAGLCKFFGNIAGEISMPIIIYNVPGRTGINIEPATMEEVCKIPNIVGVKEASGDIYQIAEVLRRCSRVAVYAGDDSLALPAYALGAVGVISVASNVTPDIVKEVYLLHSSRRVQAARELFLKHLPLYKNLFTEVNPIPVKYVLSSMGYCNNELRLPLTPLSDSKKVLLDSLMFS